MASDTTKGGPAIVTAPQEIDLSNVSEFENSLDKAIAQAPGGFIIDLTGTTYIDSAGVQAMLAAYSKDHVEDRKIAVVVGNSLVKSVLGVVHLEQLPGMYVFDDLNDAKQLLSR